MGTDLKWTEIIFNRTSYGVGLLRTNGLQGLIIERFFMNASEGRQILESRDDACASVRQILKGNQTRFEMVDFEWYNRIAKLRTRHYASYYVLCHANWLRYIGWLPYRYTKMVAAH